MSINKINYKELAEMSKSWPVPLEVVDHEGYSTLKMVERYNPLSIKESEFDMIRASIAKNGLKRGYELATAFGVSTLACGLGFKETGGKIVTMDSYIEENRKDSASYVFDKPTTYADSKGYQSAMTLIEKFGLQSTVYPTVGWSPLDTFKNISSVFDLRQESLDFVFIDAGHWDDALISDITSIVGLLNRDKYLLFIHDIHGFSGECVMKIEKLLGGVIRTVPTCALPLGYNLSYIGKNVQIADSLDNYKGGWVMGNFDPSIVKTGLTEAGVKFYKAGDTEARHVHNVATEHTIVLSGRVSMNGVEYSQKDIVTILPGTSTDFRCLEDAITLVIKTPSVPGDKYPA